MKSLLSHDKISSIYSDEKVEAEEVKNIKH